MPYFDGLEIGYTVLNPQQHRQAMREACETIEVLDELDMTDDWLQREVYDCGE